MTLKVAGTLLTSVGRRVAIMDTSATSA